MAHYTAPPSGVPSAKTAKASSSSSIAPANSSPPRTRRRSSISSPSSKRCARDDNPSTRPVGYLLLEVPRRCTSANDDSLSDVWQQALSEGVRPRATVHEVERARPVGKRLLVARALQARAVVL